MPARESVLPRWLSVEQVRKMQRMRRETVLDAIRSGELPFERRGRICYIRLSDVLAWEERRLRPTSDRKSGLVHPDLADLS
ncbi:MAG: helix-turn-helix domain-containing protein [Tepidisphaeraceae bacterium]|jgi:excisionase family DNA binding protein